MSLNQTIKFSVLCLFLTYSALSMATTLPTFPFVTVTGTSSENVKPDMAKVTFQLTTFDESSEKASNLLSSTTKSVLKVLSDNSIQLTEIEAFEINKYIRRGKDKNYNQTGIIGYEFSRNFSVNISNLESYPDIIRGLHKLDNLGNLNSQFDVSTRDDIQLTLISKATEQAKKKATIMAQGLGVRLDGVFAFNDTGSFNSFFATFGLSDGAVPMVREMTMADSSRYNKSDMPIFIPQHIEISKTINVIYKITR